MNLADCTELPDPAVYYRVNFWPRGIDWFVGAHAAPKPGGTFWQTATFVFFTTRSEAVARMVAAEQQVRLNVARKLMGLS